MKKLLQLLIFLFVVLFKVQSLSAQTSYFIDGYHGGIYGHYPLWVTKFITDSLNRYKDWKVNLEIEPESWDTIAVKDPAGYAGIKKFINNNSDDLTVEYVNPSYGQSYLYNISEESIIRQFQYGMEKLKQHFPAITFTTYSSEEPCFTSALPGILKSLGFKYASLKNPNTCWGGYVKAYGGESLNWIGPDGTGILTVPRYASEELLQNSTWQTTAWNHSKAFTNAAFNQGIQHPVGMCLQDAGWKNGPWLGNQRPASIQYTTWRDYFKLIENKKDIENWRLSQEDIKVSLVWGAQILQRLAQQIRIAENKITMAEKAAAFAKLYNGIPYPEKELNEAWRNLLLAQHHDCWIVPYNTHENKTWAEHVKIWTDKTTTISDHIIQQSLVPLNTVNNRFKTFQALNTTAFARNEIVAVQLPFDASSKSGIQYTGKPVPLQIVTNTDATKTVLFRAAIPALGYAHYTLIEQAQPNIQKGAFISNNKTGDFVMETDLYKIVIDARYGNIKQLIAKQLNNKNFVAEKNTDFNALRGYFYNNNGLKKSNDQPSKISILANGPLQIKLQVKGNINENVFVQTITLTQGQTRIDFGLHIDYKTGEGVGDDYRQTGGYQATDLRKAFYNDTSKLITTFPLNLKNQKVYKDAPLDVTESKLDNTFFNSWDKIKNNIIFNWVDITDGDGTYGLALLSDHVTNYSHGKNFPLSLTVQYAGIGLWGRNYKVDGVTSIQYALIPHKGKWDKAQLQKETTLWNQPIIISSADTTTINNAFIESISPGLSITAIYYKGNDLFLRLVNNNTSLRNHQVNLNCYADELQMVELDGTVTSSITFAQKQPLHFECSIPLFGFKTVKIINARPRPN